MPDKRPVIHDDLPTFALRIDTIEDLAAFVVLVRDHVQGKRALPGFVAAREHAARSAGFYLEITSLADFAAFMGLIRGQVVDVSALGEVIQGLEQARAVLKAASDRAGGTPASPASGPPSPVRRSPKAEGVTVMKTPQEIIQDMIDEATADMTVMGGAATVINGIDQLVKDAVAKALENGATAEQLAPFTAVTTGLADQRAALVTAIAARTAAQTELSTASGDHDKARSKKSS